ncbi:ankyrin repeat domain-containing protein [Campylobacter canadensis]|uniref:Ankyrin repeat domain-containing protein n=1 Tax=Campylobacter canadensis TaxID=449520 RepID=A0ABS7WR38_9BACT|nr:ankyrin repeat domain-containing protein [Campylobacter canadensis]MBZ7986998.1 ankyrin repeat domain-containing protein [Campylobacter canadensis]MBZ7995282.1 ankyrin repeat domain-containing protein [Campylobacter canadensis]MBZ7997176.1 ankyrin repeat domain-containing protein [Campylobacter canadensis]MBZ7998034.1 ankyrin repeat domain-containing protein [Campylobacter canadensis]MBZ8000697.1 ankyrin repeat domain-containing protein [Campylobacter canadensis]
MKKFLLLFLCAFAFSYDFEKEKLFILSNEIRGSSLECDGNEYAFYYEQYINSLNQDYNNPKLKEIKNYDKYLEYFKYWAFQSFDNYKQYERFNSYAKEFCKINKKHFDDLKANCDIFVQRFGKRAFGDITKFIKLDDIYEEFLKLDSANSIAYLNSLSLKNYELDFLLKISLLSKKDLSVISFLLNKGVDVNLGYESAIFYALDYYEALELLLENKALVDYTNAFGKSAIFYAVEENNIQAIKILLKHKANVNLSLYDNEDKIKTNLPYYIGLCSYTHPSKTLFIQAASFANTDVLKLLIDAGVDINATDSDGFNALDYANFYNQVENIEFLKKLGLKENE